MSIAINKIKKLPDTPGVYLFKNKADEIIYVGKAGSLLRRVGSYFNRAHDARIESLVAEIFDLEIRETPSVIEALILEAELIKKLAPKFNVRDKDNKSFLYVGITAEKYPKPVLVRKLEIKNLKFEIIFGPFTSAGSIRSALKILRGIFPWSECLPAESYGATKSKLALLNRHDAVPEGQFNRASGGIVAIREAGEENQSRPCFYYGIKKCPGICVGAITPKEYRKNIDGLILFFQGKRIEVLEIFKKEMERAAKAENFEKAAELRNRIHALNHIQDVSLISREDNNHLVALAKYNVMGRIEGYDISNISGELGVGSMVVFEEGRPKKSEYKKFRIKHANGAPSPDGYGNANAPMRIKGANDVGMLREVLERRLKHKDWPLPEIIFVDGGRGQVNAVEETITATGLKIPVIGIAKGLKRRNDRFIYDTENPELERVVLNFENLFKQVRDEAHRFAVAYHRKIRKI